MELMAGTCACGEAIEPLAHYYDDTNCQAGDCELWRGRQGFVVDSGVGVWIVMGYCSLWNRNLRASGRSDPAALPVCMLLSRIQILFPAADSRRWHCEAAVAQMPMSPGRIMLDASLFLDDG